MILWPKWRISGCRLVESDATANSRPSSAAFVGELGVELGGDFWVSCSSSGSCVCTLLGPVRVLLFALEFMLSVSHTLKRAGSWMVFDRAQALSKKKVRYPYKRRLFASPNLRESFCDRFRGGFVSRQTEN